MLGHELQYSAHTSVAFMRKVLAVKSVVSCTTHYDDVIMFPFDDVIMVILIPWPDLLFGSLGMYKTPSPVCLMYIGLHQLCNWVQWEWLWARNAQSQDWVPSLCMPGHFAVRLAARPVTQTSQSPPDQQSGLSAAGDMMQTASVSELQGRDHHPRWAT